MPLDLIVGSTSVTSRRSVSVDVGRDKAIT